MLSDAKELSEGIMKIGVLEEDIPVGKIELEALDTIWYIEDIYVIEEKRRQGIGTAMVQHIVNTIDEDGMFIPIEAVYGGDGDYEDVDLFFKSQGNFTVTEGDALIRITPQMRSESAVFTKLAARKKQKAENFFNLEKKIRNEFLNHLANSGYDAFLEDSEEELAKDLCFASLKDELIEAAVFVREINDKEYEISFLYVRDDSLNLMDTISAAAKVFDEAHSDADLVFVGTNEDALKLAEGMFGTNMEKYSIKTARWNGLPVS